MGEVFLTRKLGCLADGMICRWPLIRLVVGSPRRPIMPSLFTGLEMKENQRMRHMLHWHLLGSAGIALLMSIFTDFSPERTFVMFMLIAVGWGCVTNVRDAWLRWQTQRNPVLALGLAWNLGLAALVWTLYRGGWSLWASLLVLLSYSVIPWGVGRLGVRTIRPSATRSTDDE